MRPIVFILVTCHCITLVKWVASAVSRHDYSEVKLFQTPAAYDVESTVMLNDFAKTDKEVGYKIKAQLHVQPLWADSHSEFLLQFNLKSPQLHLRGKHVNADFRAFSSVWDSYKDSSFYVHWKSGVVHAAYLDQEELSDILNYKKALVSLFQFQIIDGEYNETDVTGTCDVLYESISSTVFRKIKRSCVPLQDESEKLNYHNSATEGLEVRRITRYTLGASPALETVYSDELVAAGDGELGVKARAWHRLQLATAAPPQAVPPAASLDEALKALPKGLAPTPLQLSSKSLAEDDLDLDAAVSASAAMLQTEEAGSGGRAADAAAALRLLPALRAAPQPALRRLLNSDSAYPMLSGLCRMLGLAGTRAAFAAADGFLHLSARDPLQPFAREFLAGLALAPRPSPRAVADAVRLATDARDPGVADAALLAATAAAASLEDDELQRTIRDDVARSLAKCKDDACRAVRLHALGNLARADSAELLLEHAERGGRGAALAAVDALARLPAHELHHARRRRLEAVALLPGRPLEVRAAALDLLIKRSASKPLPLVTVALELHRRGPRELRRVLWQRLRDLAPENEALRDFLPIFPKEVKTWHAQAHAGTSSVLSRQTGWAAGGRRAALESLQVAQGGLLRRGTVRLLAKAKDNSTTDLLTVEVWTRGLEAVAGGGGAVEELYEGDDDDVEVAGGLALAVAGARLPPIDLFKGQGELLGHVWAGTGSAPTPVLRAVRPLPTLDVYVPLTAGVVVRARREVAVAVALDAHATVSLWSRTARSGLDLRGGAAGRASLALRTAWADVAATTAASAEPRLRIDADLDFYDAVALCVRVRTDDYERRKESHLESVQGSRKSHVSRWRNSTVPLAGRTLSLGRAPDAACRSRAADD